MSDIPMFQNIQLFAKVKKIEAGPAGEGLNFKDFSLSGTQFGSIKDLAVEGVEVTLTISPSRRGTLWEELLSGNRIDRDSAEFEQDALGLLSFNVCDEARRKLVEWSNDNQLGAWDEPVKQELLLERVRDLLRQEDWLEALAVLMLVYNLSKPEYEAPGQDGEPEEPTLFDPPKETPGRTREELEKMCMPNLRCIATTMKLEFPKRIRKADLIESILEAQNE
ncbi:MAG: Rho termination factor N-terminal domain-containing protein [Sedimentisphaerales bacterium]|nr:Rho termination factor N-terminal domain-containing protein [Sedimentisphaerales bacterium]